jgi:hypothetical protein
LRRGLGNKKKMSKTLTPQEKRSKQLRHRLEKLIADGKLVADIQEIDTFALADTTLTLKENYELLLKELHYEELPTPEEYAEAEKEHLRTIENEYEQDFKKSINELQGGEQEKYFKTLKDYVNIVAHGFADSLIVEGTGGIGKTHEVLKTLSDSECEWDYVNSYSTPLGFYQMLYEKNGKVLVLDDFEGILNNDIGISILKGALWGVNGKRYISYYSTSDKLKIPSKFEYTGRIIFLLNSLGDNAELNALKTRALYHKLDFSFEDIKKIIMAIAKSSKNNLTEDERVKVANHIIDTADVSVKELNLRTLIKGFSIYEYAKKVGSEWKELLGGLLEVDDEKALVLRLHKECPTAEAESKMWVAETGRSARTYYRLKKSMGLTRGYGK